VRRAAPSWSPYTLSLENGCVRHRLSDTSSAMRLRKEGPANAEGKEK
jgi:hypothetical protein